jgi:hypothetical protein
MADQLLRRSNQIQQIGNPSPPNMDQSSRTMSVLQAASAPGFNFQANTGAQRNLAGAQQCRSYEGVNGVRRLARQESGRSYYDGGCGWLYKPSGGLQPEVSRGALGTSAGPTEAEDKIAGARWIWDLNEAERQISTDLCANVRACSELKLLGNYADLCGWCKSSGKAVPIRSGRARYPNDPFLQCEAENIVGAGGACDQPQTEGFLNVTMPRAFVGQGARAQMSVFRETFVDGGSLGSLGECKPPLTKDCVASAARTAGCSDRGSLITALRSAPEGQNYATALQGSAALRAYQETANPNITRAVLEDGSASMTTALADFQTLVQNTASQTPKLAFAARDLCLKAGSWDEYNFCGELVPTSIINENTIQCLQQDWKQSGGSAQGEGYPRLATWKGKTYGAYLDFRKQTKEGTQSVDKSTQAGAIARLLGLKTDSPPVRGNLPRSESTRGAETVWIQLGNVYEPDKAIPVVLRCDMRLARDGEVIPRIDRVEDISPKYGVPQDDIACSYMFEIRPDTATNLKFEIVTDDGFMLGQNQNPFENSENRAGDWGAWYYQGPTKYTSGTYAIAAESSGRPNVFVGKWFNGRGMAVHQLTMLTEQGKVLDPSASFEGRKDLYLVQEPLAPWMQVEICAKGGSVDFQDRRWYGMAALTAGGAQIPSFEAVKASITVQTDAGLRKGSPARRPYMSLVSNSWWHTRNYFAFTAFKTITMAYRPMATLAAGASVGLFGHANFAGFSISVILRKTGGKYELAFWDGSSWSTRDVAMNEWNLLVIQYIGSERGITRFTCSNFAFNKLNTREGIQTVVSDLIGPQGGVGGQLVVGGPMANLANSGFLTIGGSCPDYRDAAGKVSWTLQSFTGDVAWLHGFRNYLDTSELVQAEVSQSWLSRWPLAAMPGEA